MRIWLITVGEPLPTDDARGDRLLRTGILAEMLAGSGHEVTWWTSAFDHVRKRHRTTGDERVITQSGYRLWLLHANGYKKNVSLRRVAHQRLTARKFRELAPDESRPDVILTSWPTIELCVEAVRFGNLHNVPVVIDLRDMWPDAVRDVAPRPLRPLARVLLHRTYRNAFYAASNSTAMTGMTDKIIDWALRFARRERSELDRPFPMGYRRRAARMQGEDEAEADQFWQSHGITGESSQFVACFFGTFGRHFEFETLIAAARRFKDSQRDVRLVLCGDGPSLAHWRKVAADCPNVVLPGWVNAAQIRSLMRRSAVGLAPYYSSWDFRIHIPNKPIEYFSGGLPVVSSLQGELARLLAENDCGFTYANGSTDDLVRTLADCYDHPANLAVLAGNAARLYEERFVAETVYGQMSDYLCGLAAGGTRSRAA